MHSLQSLWMIVASLFFACMGVCVKLGASHFSAAELVFYRGFIAIILVWSVVAYKRWSLCTPHWRGHLWRGATGFVSLVMYFYAISVMPLATAVALNYTSPLFLALLLVVWAGERVRWPLLLALVIGLAGVVLLLRPSFASKEWLGGVLALASGMLSSFAYYNVRQLGRLGEPEWRTVFYFSLFSAIGGLPWVLASYPFHGVDQNGVQNSLHHIGWPEVLLMLGVGGFGSLAQLAMTRAYNRGKTLMTASFAYSTVIFASLFGVVLWGEVLVWSSWLAIAMIVASGVLASAQSKSAVEPE